MSTCPPHSGRGWASAQPGRLRVLFRMQRCLEIWTSFSRCILIWGFRLSMRLGNVLAMCCFTVFMLIYVLTVFGCLCLIFTFCTAHCIQLWFIFLKCSRNKVELKWVDEFFVLSYTIWDTSELQTPITPDPINSHWVFFCSGRTISFGGSDAPFSMFFFCQQIPQERGSTLHSLLFCAHIFTLFAAYVDLVTLWRPHKPKRIRFNWAGSGFFFGWFVLFRVYGVD